MAFILAGICAEYQLFLSTAHAIDILHIQADLCDALDSGETALALTYDLNLAEQPMILHDIPPSRSYVTSLLEEIGLTPKVRFCSPSFEMVRGMVGHGLVYCQATFGQA